MNADELTQFEKEIGDKRTYKRFLCVKLQQVEGLTAREISQQTGYNQRYVQKIQALARDHGLQALLAAKRTGNHRLLPLEQEKAILEGCQQVITVAPIVEAFSQALGRPVSDKTIYSLLKRHGWKAKRPRPRHPKADAEAQAFFKKPVRAN
jgi:transposase